MNRGASRYFAVGTLMFDNEDAVRALRQDLLDLRDDLAANGVPHHESFHASEDPQHVRNAVFAILNKHEFRADVTLLEKAKAQPQTHTSDAMFYKYAWYYHFKWFAGRYFLPNDDLMVVSAALGTKKTKAAFRTVVQDVVTQVCDYRVNRRFGFWSAESDPALQATDYVLWAITREWEGGDPRARQQIASKIGSMYDLWSAGTKYYYGSAPSKSA